METFQDFHGKYLEKQLKLDVDLRWWLFLCVHPIDFLNRSVCVWFGGSRQIEEVFTLELSKSNERMVKMNSEMCLLQVIPLRVTFYGYIYDAICRHNRANWMMKSAAVRSRWRSVSIWRLKKSRVKSNFSWEWLSKSTSSLCRCLLAKSIRNSSFMFVGWKIVQTEKQETAILLTTCTRNWHKLTRKSLMWKENARKRQSTACKCSSRMWVEESLHAKTARRCPKFHKLFASWIFTQRNFHSLHRSS